MSKRKPYQKAPEDDPRDAVAPRLPDPVCVGPDCAPATDDIPVASVDDLRAIAYSEILEGVAKLASIGDYQSAGTLARAIGETLEIESAC